MTRDRLISLILNILFLVAGLLPWFVPTELSFLAKLAITLGFILIAIVIYIGGSLWERKRIRERDPKVEIPRLFADLQALAGKYGIPMREPLVKNGQPLPPDAVKQLQNTTRQLESFAHALILSAQEYFEFGNAYFALQQFRQAIEKYNKSLTFVENPLVFNNRGVAFCHLGQYERAIQDFDKALELKPADPEARANLGGAYSKLGQHERAIHHYDKALELKPDWPGALYNRGSTYYDLAQYERAIQDFDKALKLQPDYSKALNNRGNAYLLLGRYERAVQDYEQVLAFKPGDTVALNNRGLARAHLGQYQHAIQDFNRALQIDADYSDPRYSMACVYSLMNRPDEALKWLREVIDLDRKYLDMAKTDSDFDNIRDDPRFKELVGE